MKAAVCYEFGKPLVVEEIEIDPPKGGEIKVKVAACAICHSDVHLIRGEWGEEPPLVAGHEAAGVVEETGPGVSRLRPGDHVVVTLIRSCGSCYFCTIGRPFNCEASFPLQTESRLRNKDGISIAHGIKTAAFAEACIVDQSQAVKIPRDLSLECASLLACGVITGLGSVTNTARVEARSRVAVIGAGGVGVNAVQGAALSGASMIIAVDLRDDKLEAATDALVDELLTFSPLAQRTAKKLLNDTEDSTLAIAIELEGHCYSRLRQSNDFKEGVEAFHGKRDSAAIAAAWPHLGSTDRFVRWAARTALEHQPIGALVGAHAVIVQLVKAVDGEQWVLVGIRSEDVVYRLQRDGVVHSHSRAPFFQIKKNPITSSATKMVMATSP